MATQPHIAEERRHQILEKKMAETLKHNSIEDLEVVELKRQKLHFEGRD